MQQQLKFYFPARSSSSRSGLRSSRPAPGGKDRPPSGTSRPEKRCQTCRESTTGPRTKSFRTEENLWRTSRSWSDGTRPIRITQIASLVTWRGRWVFSSKSGSLWSRRDLERIGAICPTSSGSSGTEPEQVNFDFLSLMTLANRWKFVQLKLIYSWAQQLRSFLNCSNSVLIVLLFRNWRSFI